jgi:predicted small lipoprotein YifL
VQQLTLGLLLSVLCMTLTACGQKGPLYIPNKNPDKSTKTTQQEKQGKRTHDLPLHEDAWTW